MELLYMAFSVISVILSGVFSVAVFLLSGAFSVIALLFSGVLYLVSGVAALLTSVISLIPGGAFLLSRINLQMSMLHWIRNNLARLFVRNVYNKVYVETPGDAYMNQSGKITVVIPNYNGMKYIKDCLDSLLAGTWVPEIIVVDNGSADGSADYIAEHYPDVLLLRLKANTGFCHAVNAGIHITRRPYVILLNNDVRVDTRFVEALYTCIVQNKKAFSAQARMLSMKDPDVLDDAGDYYCALGWAFARGKGKSAARYVRQQEVFSACAGAAIYRMSVFDEIGLFDERHFCYLEDVDIGYRARIHGYRNLYAPEAIVYHAGSASSGAVHNPFKERMTSGNNAYLLYKNMPTPQYILNAPLIALGRKVKRKYFYNKGLGEDYDYGLERGEYLKQRAMVRDLQTRYDLTPTKESLPIEACLEDADAAQQEVLPLYLGGKVPFELRHLPNYVRIQSELWSNCVRRLLG